MLRRKRAAYRTSLHHLLQRKVHPRITCNQVSVQRLAILELHQHGVALRGCEEAEGKLTPLLAHP
jgi:hypothetical protein